MDNYAEETQPLFKLLRTPLFRFVLVRFNHYSLQRQLQSDLRAQFPDRKVCTIDMATATYPEILNTYLELEAGFLFLENFEDILKRDADSLGKVTPEMTKNNERRRGIAAGLNMRRDKLAKYPIAIVAFVFASAGKLYARSVMEKMPDLWSFRSLLLDLKLEQQAVTPRTLPMETQWEPTSISTLGGSSREKKLAELDRLLNEVKATPETETNYLKTLYEQIFQIERETEKNKDAFNTIETLIEKTNDGKQKIGLLVSKGDLLRNGGFFEDALKIFIEAKHLCEKIEDDYPLGIVFQRLGDVYCDLKILDEGLSYYQQAFSIMQKLHKTSSLNADYANGLGISLFKLATIYKQLNEFDKALTYYFKDLELSKSLYLSDNRNISHKNSIAISNSKIGDVYLLLGEFDQALLYYENAVSLFKELYDIDHSNFKEALAINYLKYGNAFKELDNRNKAISLFKIGEELFLELQEQNKWSSNFESDLDWVRKELASLDKSKD